LTVFRASVFAAGTLFVAALTAAIGRPAPIPGVPKLPGKPVHFDGGIECVRVPYSSDWFVRCTVPDPTSYQVAGIATAPYNLGVDLECGTLPLNPHLGLAATWKSHRVTGSFDITSEDSWATRFLALADICQVGISLTPTDAKAPHRLDGTFVVNNRLVWTMHEND